VSAVTTKVHRYERRYDDPAVVLVWYPGGASFADNKTIFVYAAEDGVIDLGEDWIEAFTPSDRDMLNVTTFDGICDAYVLHAEDDEPDD